MTKQRKTFTHNATRLLTCGALAAILAVGPGVYVSNDGFSSYPSAHAQSCFIKGTKVLMADGNWKAIEQVRIGDLVVGDGGAVNRVTEVERVPLAGRKLYSFNGSAHFVTAEHPFMTAEGWKSINPSMTAEETPNLQVAVLGLNDRLMKLEQYRVSFGGNGNLALEMAPEIEFILETLTQIDAIDADPQETVFNLLLDGNHTYIADGFLVHNKGGDSDGGGSGGGDDGGNSGSGGGDDGGTSGSGGGDDGGDDGGDSGDDGGDSGDDSSGGHGSDDDGDDGDDGSGGRGSDDDGDDSSGSRNSSSSDDSADSLDDDDSQGRGRGRGRGQHATDDDGLDNSDDDATSGGRRGDDDRADDDRADADLTRERERFDNRTGVENTPDFTRDRGRIERTFDAQGNLVSETTRMESRRGAEDQPGFSRERTETTRTFDDQGNVTSEQTRVDSRSGVENTPDFSRDRVRTTRSFDAEGNVIAEDSRTDSRQGAEGTPDFSRERSRSSFRNASLTPAGPDLSTSEEASAIANGWQ